MRCKICDYDEVTKGGLLEYYDSANIVLQPEGVCMECTRIGVETLNEFGLQDEVSFNPVSRGVGEANETTPVLPQPDTLTTSPEASPEKFDIWDEMLGLGKEGENKQDEHDGKGKAALSKSRLPVK